MKNANSRFVRVLAIVLVVLMVVPAALVGCGSNKANNAAISEALAAAEAARKEAEEAKAAADAAAAEAAAKAAAEAQKALEEANKKAEEAIKAAEEAKKKAEEAEKQAAEAAKTTAAPTTTAPVTTAPTEDMKVVSDYAYQVLNNKDLDFLKTYFTYAYGKTEDDLKIAKQEDVKQWLLCDPVLIPALANVKYEKKDIKAMVDLYDATVVAIYQANTVDYINQLVANFVATIAGTPTYVERVVDAYEAIDFDSDYDVLDVVYATALIETALTEMDAKDKDVIAKFGEDQIDIVETVYTEYYRYTGVNHGTIVDESDFDEDDILYKEMYEAAQITDAVIVAVYDLFSVTVAGAELDVSKLLYFPEIDDALEDAEEAYAKWNNKYFVKANNAELLAAYETFRQAFVGEDYVLEYDNDYAWDAVVASAARVEQLLAAAEEAKTLAKSIKKIADLETDPAAAVVAGKPVYTDFKYEKHVNNLATIKADLAAWKAKYGFKDVNGVEDANVAAIIDPENKGIYTDYKSNATVIEYFAYLEKTASAINVEAFLDASEEKLGGVDYRFDFKKYGSAVGAVVEWYFGKAKTVSGTTTYEGGFDQIDASEIKDFETLGSQYDVATLITANDHNIKRIFDELFDINITVDIDAGTPGKQTIFTAMQKSYNDLLAKKKAADDINDDIEEALELGVTVKTLSIFTDLFVPKDNYDYEDFADADEDEKDDFIEDGDIFNWATAPIVIGDENFMNLIDWASLDTVYANYKESLKEVIADSAEVALEYIAWQAALNPAMYDEDDEQIKFTYGTKDYYFSDLKPAQIDIYSYARIKNVIELEKTLEDLFDADDAAIVNTLQSLKADVPDDDEELDVPLTAIIDYCADMVAEFYSIAAPIHSNLAGVQDNYPLLADKGNTVNPWKDSKDGSTAVTGEMVLEFAMFGRLGGSKDEEYKTIRDAVYAVLNVSKYKYHSTVSSAAGLYGTSNGKVWNNTLELYPISYQGAIYSVDPLKYAIRNADDKITGFDSAAYKAALDSSISSVYAKFLPAYVKDTARSGDFNTIVTNLTTTFYNYGIWNVEDEIEFDDEVYTYAIVSNGKTADLVVYDSSDEKVSKADDATNPIEFKYDNNTYAVTLKVVTDFSNGKFSIVPEVYKVTYTVVPGTDSVEYTRGTTLLDNTDADTTNNLPANKKDAYDFLGLKKEDLVYDIRNYTDVIAENYVKIGAVKALGDSSNYRSTNKAELDTIFGYEAKNDFYTTFETLREIMYNKASATSANWGTFGSYIKGWDTKKTLTGSTAITDNFVDAKTFDAIIALSKLARDDAFAMTADANTIKDIEKVFNNFATRVKAVLEQNGYGVTLGTENGYEQITGIVKRVNISENADATFEYTTSDTVDLTTLVLHDAPVALTMTFAFEDATTTGATIAGSTLTFNAAGEYDITVTTTATTDATTSIDYAASSFTFEVVVTDPAPVTP